LKANESEMVQLKHTNQLLQTQLYFQNLTISDQGKLIQHLLNRIDNFERGPYLQSQNWQASWTHQSNEKAISQPLPWSHQKQCIPGHSTQSELVPLEKPKMFQPSVEPDVKMTALQDLTRQLRDQKHPNHLEVPSSTLLRDTKKISTTGTSAIFPYDFRSNQEIFVVEQGARNHLEGQCPMLKYQMADEKDKNCNAAERFTMSINSRNSFHTPDASDVEEDECHSPSLKENMVDVSSHQSSSSQRVDKVKVSQNPMLQRGGATSPRAATVSHLRLPSYVSTSGNSTLPETDQTADSKAKLQSSGSVLNYCSSLGPERVGRSIIDLISMNDTKQADSRGAGRGCHTLTAKEEWLYDRLYGRSITDRIKQLPTSRKEIVEQVLSNLIDEYDKLNHRGDELSVKDDTQLTKIFNDAKLDLRERGGLNNAEVDRLLEAITRKEPLDCPSDWSSSSSIYGSGWYTDEKTEVREGDYYKYHHVTWQINENVKTVFGRLRSFIHFIEKGEDGSHNKRSSSRPSTSTCKDTNVELQSRISLERDSPHFQSTYAQPELRKQESSLEILGEISENEWIECVDGAKPHRANVNLSLEESDNKRLLLEQKNSRTSENDIESSPSVNVYSSSLFASTNVNAAPPSQRLSDKQGHVTLESESRDIQNLD